MKYVFTSKERDTPYLLIHARAMIKRICKYNFSKKKARLYAVSPHFYLDRNIKCLPKGCNGRSTSKMKCYTPLTPTNGCLLSDNSKLSYVLFSNFVNTWGPEEVMAMVSSK